MKTLIINFLTIIATFITPIYSLVLLVIGIVLLDTVTAIWAAIKKEGRKGYRSGKLFNMIPKIFFYSFSILITFLMDFYIFGGSLYGIHFLLSKATCFVAIWIEGTSINENSMKMGNRSIGIILKDIILKIKLLKKDINEIRE